jgi:apolipoprotein N-acyltransferase
MRFFLNRLDQEAKHHHTALVVGLPIDEQDQYFNSALVLGEGRGRYDKYHLVPFGEYAPFKTWIKPILDQWNIPMSDFSQGPQKQPLAILKGHPVALFSCFETIFSDHMRDQLQNAKAIVILSDDGWFGHSFAAQQQSQVSRMRAKELGRSVVAVGNTGITAIIGWDGRIQAQLRPHEQNVLTAHLSLCEGQTPYLYYGNLAWLFIMTIISIFLLAIYIYKNITNNLTAEKK